MLHHSNEAGILVSSVPMPGEQPDRGRVAEGRRQRGSGHDETVLYPGDKAIVVADNGVLRRSPGAVQGGCRFRRPCG